MSMLLGRMNLADGDHRLSRTVKHGEGGKDMYMSIVAAHRVELLSQHKKARCVNM